MNSLCKILAFFIFIQTPCLADDQENSKPVITMLGLPLYQPEYSFWQRYVSRIMKSNGQEISEELVRTEALALACYERSVNVYAESSGISLTDADRNYLSEKREANIRIYGNATEYFRIIARHYVNESVYSYLQETELKAAQLFNLWFGEKGQNLKNKDLISYLAENPLYSGFYLKLPKTVNGHDQYKKIAELRNSILQSKDKYQKIRELIRSETRDLKQANMRHGRQFVQGTLPSNVESAFSEVAVGELSSVVTTNDAYFVILPTSLEADTLINNTGKTLRYWVAYDGLFKAKIKAPCNEELLKHTLA